MNPVGFLLISLCLTSLMLAVIFLLAWVSFGRKAHALTWSLTFLVGAVQWLVNVSRDSFPNRATYWITVNALALTVVSLGLVGHRRRVGLPDRLPLIIGGAVALEAVIIWFTVVRPHVGAQMAFVPLYGAVVIALSARVVLGYRRQPVPAEWGAAAVMILFAASQIAAGFAALLQGTEARQPYMDVYRQINFLVLPAAYTGMGMFVVFILASDLSEEMKEVARHDPLTGVLNRRGFAEAAERALAHARRREGVLSVVIGDIDHFKAINDSHGHARGDLALRHFAGRLAAGTRAQDVLARMGGEEFALVLPGTSPEQAAQLAERLRLDLEGAPVEAEGRPIRMTASFGVAGIVPDDACIEDLMKRADAALYLAKGSGRNRVETATANAERRRGTPTEDRPGPLTG